MCCCALQRSHLILVCSDAGGWKNTSNPKHDSLKNYKQKKKKRHSIGFNGGRMWVQIFQTCYFCIIYMAHNSPVQLVNKSSSENPWKPPSAWVVRKTPTSSHLQLCLLVHNYITLSEIHVKNVSLQTLRHVFATL